MSRAKPVGLAVVWLLIAASRIQYLAEWANLSRDEIWAAWRSIGTPAEIIRWTPLDWPPGSYLMIGVWEYLVGIHPVVLRVLPLLVFLFGLAVMYRLVAHMHSESAALLAVLAFAASGEGIYRSVFLRGQAFMLGLLPLLFFGVVLYFERRRWWLGVALGVLLAFYLYLHTTAAVLFVLLGAYTMFVFPRQVWRWWLPVGVMLVLAAPEIYDKYQLAVGRVTNVPSQHDESFWASIEGVYNNFSGRLDWVWLALGVVAAVMLVIQWRQHARPVAGLLVWALAPFAYYVLEPALKMYNPRYMPWVFWALAMLMGLGLAGLPRLARVGAGVTLAAVMLFAPVDRLEFEADIPYEGEAVAQLAEKAHWGDVVVLDPGVVDSSRNVEFWDYYQQVYFSNGLAIVDDPGASRRVWYVYDVDDEGSDTQQAVQSGRMRVENFGPPDLITALYAAPPDPDGLRFENGMRLHGVEVLDDERLDMQYHHVRKKGEAVTVRIWWSADEPLERDYSVGVFMFHDERVVDEVHAGTTPPTSQWEPGQYYVEERTLTIPNHGHMTTRYMDVKLTVYQWWDNQRIDAETADENHLVTLAQITVRLF